MKKVIIAILGLSIVASGAFVIKDQLDKKNAVENEEVEVEETTNNFESEDNEDNEDSEEAEETGEVVVDVNIDNEVLKNFLSNEDVADLKKLEEEYNEDWQELKEEYDTTKARKSQDLLNTANIQNAIDSMQEKFNAVDTNEKYLKNNVEDNLNNIISQINEEYKGLRQKFDELDEGDEKDKFKNVLTQVSQKIDNLKTTKNNLINTVESQKEYGQQYLDVVKNYEDSLEEYVPTK